MKTILRISCSPRGRAAESYRLSDGVIDHLTRRYPDAVMIERDLGGVPIAPIDEAYAISQQSSDDVGGEGTMARSEALIQELESADIVVIATPMHNMTAPVALKAWIDHVVRARRTFNVTPAGKVGLLRDRPVFLAIASGGRFSGERARQPDFLTPYLQAVLATIGLRDLRVFSVQGTGAGPDAIAAARITAGDALHEHFALFPG